MDFWEWIKTSGGRASSISAIIALATMILFKPIKAQIKKRREKQAAETKFKADLLASLAAMNKRIDEIESNQLAAEKDHIRSSVFRFAAECRRGEGHTLEEYNHLFEMDDRYRKMLKITGDPNGKYCSAREYIMSVYQRCQAENDFLK